MLKTIHKKAEQGIKQSHEKLLSIILKKRRVHQKKFQGSSLERLIVKLVNEGIPDEDRQEMVMREGEVEA